MYRILHTQDGPPGSGVTECVLLPVQCRPGSAAPGFGLGSASALRPLDANVRVFEVSKPSSGQAPGTSTAPFTGASSQRASGSGHQERDDDFAADYGTFFAEKTVDFCVALDFDFASLFAKRSRGGAHAGHAVFGDEKQFAKQNALWLESSKRVNEGRVLFVRRSGASEGNATARMVIKQQYLREPQRDCVVTPTPSRAELTALFQLNFLMRHKHVAPLFCELKSYTSFYDEKTTRSLLSTSMPRYDVDVHAWMHTECPQKPNYTTSADPRAAWVYSQGAGRVLARSAHKPDVAIFNLALRSVLLQVFVALAQAQRYMCFTHNDLHAGNVMFDTCELSASRLMVTALGSFVLPQDAPGIRIIDFQHAALDTYDSQWRRTGRLHGVPESVYNGFSMHYDVWRFCSNLVISCLWDVWSVVDRDVQAFLWALCRFPGPPGSGLPKLTKHQHWSPYLVTGSPPEDLLADAVFDRFRCDPQSAVVHVVRLETPDAVARFDDEAYVRRRVLCTRDAILGLERNAMLSLFAPAPLPPAQNDLEARRLEALERHLDAMAVDYANNAVNNALLKHEHTVAQKAAFLYMELLILQRAAHYFWSVLAAPEALPPDQPAVAHAALDALVVVLKADFTWIGRPQKSEEQARYVRLVGDLLAAPAVRAVASAPLVRLPAHALPASFLEPDTESDNNRLKELLLQSVKRALYC